MSKICPCPKCNRQVSIPVDVLPQATVRCPLCHAEYTLAEALDYVPPLLMLVEGEDLLANVEADVDEADVSARVPLADASGQSPQETHPRESELSFDFDLHSEELQQDGLHSDEDIAAHAAGAPDAIGDVMAGAEHAEPRSADFFETFVDDSSRAGGEPSRAARESIAADAGEILSLDDDEAELQFHSEPDVSAAHAEGETLEFEPLELDMLPPESHAGESVGKGHVGSREASGKAHEEMTFDLDLEEPAFVDLSEADTELESHRAGAGHGSARREADEVVAELDFGQPLVGEGESGEEVALDEDAFGVEPEGADEEYEPEFEFQSADATSATGHTQGHQSNGRADKIPLPSRRKKPRERSVVGSILGVLISGMIGLGGAYLGIIWWQPSADALHLGAKLPAWMVPAELRESAGGPTEVAVVDTPGSVPVASQVEKQMATPDSAFATPAGPTAASPDAADSAKVPTAATVKPEAAVKPEADAASAGDPFAPDAPEQPLEAAGTTPTAPGTSTVHTGGPAGPGAATPASSTPPSGAQTTTPPPSGAQSTAPPPEGAQTPTLAPPEPQNGASPTPAAAEPGKDGSALANTVHRPSLDDPDPFAVTEPTQTPAAASPSTKVGPKNAPQFAPADVAKARAELTSAAEALARAPAGPERKRAKLAFYKSLYNVAGVTTFAAGDPQSLEAERKQIHDVASRLAGNAAGRKEMGRVGAQWLTLAPARRGPHQGVALSGTVEAAAKQGQFFEVRLHLDGGPEQVTVLSAEDPKVQPGQPLVVLGSIVADPAGALAGYQGRESVVVWSGVVVKPSG